MASPGFRLPEFEYPKNALLNFAPINDAIDSYSRNRQQGVENERQNKLLGFKQQEMDQSNKRFELDKRKADQASEAVDIERLGRQSVAIHGLQGPQRQTAYQTMLADNPQIAEKLPPELRNDHINGPKFLAEQWGAYDESKKRQIDADINLKGAHANYYNRAAAAQSTKETARNDIPDGAIYPVDDGVGVRNSQFNPSAAVRGVDVLQNNGEVPEAHQSPRPRMQPPMRLGGLVDDIDRSILPDEGRPRPQGVQVAQSGNLPPLMDQAIKTTGNVSARRHTVQFPSMSPSHSDLADLGFSEEIIADLRRSNAMAKTLGKPKVGHVWYMNESGRPDQKMVSEKGPASKHMSAPQIKFNLDNLDKAFRVLAGNTDSSGQLTNDSDPSGFNLSVGGIASDLARTRGAVGSIAGTVLNSTLGEKQTAFRQAFDAGHHSAYNLLVALSGQSFGARELEYVVPFFAPSPADNREMRAFKIDGARKLFTSLIEAQSKGASAEVKGQIFNSALSRAAAGVAGIKGQDQGQSGERHAPAPGGGSQPPQVGVRGLTTDELIKRLNGGR